MLPQTFDQLSHTQLNPAQRACYVRLLEGLRAAARISPQRGMLFLSEMTDPQRKVIQLLINAANKRHMLLTDDIETLRKLKFCA